jgi:hypothetical protein
MGARFRVGVKGVPVLPWSVFILTSHMNGGNLL